MTTKEEVLRRLQSGEISVLEASALIDALPQKPLDIGRLRAIGQIKTQLEALERIEIETKVFNLKDVAQWLDGGDWLFSTMPFISDTMTLTSDRPGSFRNETGEGGREAFNVSPEKNALTITVGKPTGMSSWGILGPAKHDIYVSVTLHLIPRPIDETHSSNP